MKKLLLIGVILVLCGCAWLTGKKVTTTDPVTGEVVVTYEKAPIEGWVNALTLLVPGLAVVAGAATQIAVKTARAKNAIFDTNKEAIAQLGVRGLLNADTAKEILKVAQDAHPQAKLIAKEYKKWKAKGEKG